MKNELDLLGTSLFEVKKGTDFDSVLSNLIRQETRDLVLSFILNEDKKKVIEDLKNELMKIKFVEVILAVDPSYELVEKILARIKSYVKENIAIDVKVDSSIIAGATVSYEGRFFDGSMLKNFEAVFENYE